ncbi:hypothetical protein F5Y10DRAFT_244307 [Nemania abortiva]|nr:hypothetical protein F5Y10DRAFT_244307 [Nemania abortiva]
MANRRATTLLVYIVLRLYSLALVVEDRVYCDSCIRRDHEGRLQPSRSKFKRLNIVQTEALVKLSQHPIPITTTVAVWWHKNGSTTLAFRD